MRNRWLILIVALAAVVGASSLLFAQGESASGKKDPGAAGTFNPHDLSGYWEFFNNTPGQGIYATPSKDGPPGFTPWGKAQFEANKPSYGPRTVQLDNDPIQKCRPTGIPRVMFYPQPFEIVQDPARTFFFFEREHAWRGVWTDGRGHTQDPDPTFMGESIGKWDGDTFVVDSIGFNDRPWLDFYGYPRSDALHLIERFKRVNANTMSWQFTVDDPKAYTGKWESDIKLFKLLTGKRAVMDELFCVSEDEEAFTQKLRNPARGMNDPNKAGAAASSSTPVTPAAPK
jgi:hypothetical protein